MGKIEIFWRKKSSKKGEERGFYKNNRKRKIADPSKIFIPVYYMCNSITETILEIQTLETITGLILQILAIANYFIF